MKSTSITRPKKLFKNTKGSFITISADGKITDINETSVKHTGIERDAIIGTQFSDHFIEKLEGRKQWEHVFEKGFIENYPFTIKHKDGKLTDIIYSASMYKDDQGISHGFFTEATDSIAQKLAAQYSQSLIEASLDPLITINDVGEIMDMNQALINVTGYSRKKLKDSNFSNYFTDTYKAQEVYQSVFKNNAIKDFALTLQRKNGELIDVLFNGAVYKDSLGKVQGVVVVARTIDKQKWALDLQIVIKKVAVQKIEAKERATELMIVSKKLENQRREKEKQAKELEAVNKKLLRDNKEREIIALKLADANKELSTVSNEKQKKSAELVRANKELVLQMHDNQKCVNELVKVNKELASRIKEKEQWKTVSKELKKLNITATLDSQYNLSLIEASQDPLITINKEGQITDMNEAFVISTGLSRAAVTNSNFLNYFTEKPAAQFLYREVFSKGFISDAPLTLKHKNGKLTDVLFNGSVYKNEEDIIAGVVLVARDITEQKKIAAAIIEAKEQAILGKENAEEARKAAENAVQAKQQFLSNMSHEIRTPMNAIIGFTKVVLKTDLTEKQREYLKAIKMSGDAMIVLINDILDLAKYESGKMSFEKVNFKLRSSISSMLQIFEPKIQEKNLELVQEIDRAIPDNLVGDPLRLHQIILNLISNAVKFTALGKISLKVKLMDQDEQKVIIQFSITDTGIGIPKDQLELIFENFQQASSHTSRLYGGTGLGLAIVKQLIELQGGDINVKSIEGFGSTFSFTLSFFKANTNVDEEKNSIQTKTEIKDINVLIVEDIPLNQLLLKTLLDDYGFQHDSAENGAIAVQKLKQNKFDIILMDLQMPVMNGFETTQYVRETLKSKIPIIALTADVTAIDLKKCKEMGMNDYLAKPVDERILFNKIIKITEKSQHKIALDKNAIESKELIHKESCIDLKYLKQITKSNPKLMMELIQLYLTQTPVLINAINQNWKTKNWNAISAAIHKILPSFAIVGMSPDYQVLAKKIQKLAGDRIDSDEIKELIFQLEYICNQACEELTCELDKIKITVQ